MRPLLLLTTLAGLAAHAQTPDTTTAARYVPLAVGNEWHYHQTESGSNAATTQWRYHVVGAEADTFTVQAHRERTPVGGGTTETTQTLRWWHDAATGRLRGQAHEVNITASMCPLSAPFGAGIPCANGLFYTISGGYGEPVTVGADTVMTSRKVFQAPTGAGCVMVTLRTEFGAGLGETFYRQIVNDPCGSSSSTTTRRLAYARVGGVEHGEPLFTVAGEDAPGAPGLALAVAPNPSAGAATLRYVLPAPGAVRLVVLDALGRTVARLADGEHAAGTHTVALGTSRLAPGVYVARLDAAGTVATRRFTVAR